MGQLAHSATTKHVGSVQLNFDLLDLTSALPNVSFHYLLWLHSKIMLMCIYTVSVSCEEFMKAN